MHPSLTWSCNKNPWGSMFFRTPLTYIMRTQNHNVFKINLTLCSTEEEKIPYLFSSWMLTIPKKKSTCEAKMNAAGATRPFVLWTTTHQSFLSFAVIPDANAIEEQDIFFLEQISFAAMLLVLFILLAASCCVHNGQSLGTVQCWKHRLKITRKKEERAPVALWKLLV